MSESLLRELPTYYRQKRKQKHIRKRCMHIESIRFGDIDLRMNQYNSGTQGVTINRVTITLEAYIALYWIGIHCMVLDCMVLDWQCCIIWIAVWLVAIDSSLILLLYTIVCVYYTLTTIVS